MVKTDNPKTGIGYLGRQNRKYMQKRAGHVILRSAFYRLSS